MCFPSIALAQFGKFHLVAWQFLPISLLPLAPEKTICGMHRLCTFALNMVSFKAQNV
jgi:hypothetical protein